MKVTTELEKRLWYALKRISMYEPPERLRRTSEKQYGLSGNEAIEGAYENIIFEAKTAIKGVRLLKPTQDVTSKI